MRAQNRERDRTDMRKREKEHREKREGWNSEPEKWEGEGGRRNDVPPRSTTRRGGRNAADAKQKRSALSAVLFAGITVSTSPPRRF